MYISQENALTLLKKSETPYECTARPLSVVEAKKFLLTATKTEVTGNRDTVEVEKSGCTESEGFDNPNNPNNHSPGLHSPVPLYSSPGISSESTIRFEETQRPTTANIESSPLNTPSQRKRRPVPQLFKRPKYPEDPGVVAIFGKSQLHPLEQRWLSMRRSPRKNAHEERGSI